MLVISIFSFSHNVFFFIKARYQHFICNVFEVCKCFQLGPVQNHVVWLRVYLSSADASKIDESNMLSRVLSFSKDRDRVNVRHFVQYSQEVSYNLASQNDVLLRYAPKKNVQTTLRITLLTLNYMINTFTTQSRVLVGGKLLKT